ncbi:MAG: alanyl-tRNA editing protein [Pleomorphochaeta sp.]
MSEELKQYYINPYQKELITKITKINDNKVYLEKTIFYPEGGGQPGDIGFINNIKVIDTQKDSSNIAHIVENSDSFTVGDVVSIKLNWDHRYEYMKMHTAQHLISGILYSKFDVNTVSVHQGNPNLTIEIDRANFSEEDCYLLEDLSNEAIVNGNNISYLEMNKAEAEKLGMRRSIKVDGLIRIVDVKSIDKIACGGLHVNNTREIGKIMFIGFEKIRKHYRLIFRVSNRVSETYRELDKVVKTLCTMHSATISTLVDCDKALLEKKLDLEKEVRALKKKNTNYYINSILKDNTNIIIQDISKEDIDFKDIEISEDKVVFLYKIENEMLKWFIYLGDSYKEYNINDIRKDVLIKINGKGGGKFPNFQGKGEITNIDECIVAFKDYFNE